MMPFPHASGDRLRVRGSVWRLRDAAAFGDVRTLDLESEAPGPWGMRRVLFAPFDRPVPLAHPRGCRVVSRRAWMRRLAQLIVEMRTEGDLLTAAPARIDLLPYQLEPALAVLGGGATRILIADAVGLGKTIQAALVLAELIARARCERALIVTPSGLRDQWDAEIRSRFAVEATVADAAWLRAARARWPPSVNPWAVPGVLVASLDFVKRPENLRAIESLTWDVFVLDEAHMATADSDRGAAARRLAARARHVVLLSATPHSGDPAAFASLCDLGALGPDDRLAMFRRTRAGVGLAARRRVHLLRVRPTRDERRVHRLLGTYVDRVWRAPAELRRARLAMAVLLKRAFSSAGSLLRSLEYRRATLGHGAPAGPLQMSLPLDAEEDPGDEPPSSGLDAPGLRDADEEHEWLRRLLRLARAAATQESKAHAVARLVSRTGEPVIVFTEYRDTLERLAAVVGRVAPCTLLHGGLDRQARLAAVRAFEQGDARVLLATDVGGQGLNLQGRCRLVVNVELPWNPVRVEQRIGRVDRIGQARTVHAVHLVARGTRESSVLARLTSRLERARRDLGALDDVLGTHDDVTVADAIVRNGDIELPRAGTGSDPEATRPVRLDFGPQATLACSAAAKRRRAMVSARTRPRDRQNPADASTTERTLAVRVPRRRMKALTSAAAAPGDVAALLIWLIRMVDRAGRRVEERLVPVAVRGCVTWPRRPRDLRRAVEGLIAEHGTDLAAPAHARALARALELREERAGGRTHGLARERALVGEASHPRPMQPGLFDRRAIREAERAAEVRRAQRRAAAARIAALDDSMDVSLAAEPDLALVLALSD